MKPQTSKQMTAEEAKKNFAAAMEKLDPAVIIREYPLKSVGTAAAAGAAAYLSGRRALKLMMPAAGIAEFLLKRYCGVK